MDRAHSPNGGDIGSGLLIAGLVSVFMDFRSQQDAEDLRDEGLRRLLKEAAPEIRDSVIEGFATKPDAMARVASPETLDQVAQNALGLRLGDQQFASEIYDELKAQVIGARTRYYNAKASITLSPWGEGSQSGPDAMFVVTVRWEFEVEPLAPVVRFSCVSNEEEYRTLLRDPSTNASWLFRGGAGLDASSREAFELVQFTLDGKEQRIRRSVRSGGQTYSVTAPAREKDGKRPTVAYTFRSLVRREARMINVDIGQPTRGLSIDFSYGGCGIERVRVLDYIASAAEPRIARLPASAPAPSVSVGFDGWVWPKSGVCFAWKGREPAMPWPSGTTRNAT